MTIPMLAGTYPKALLMLIQQAAKVAASRGRLDAAVRNVRIEPWSGQSVRSVLDETSDSGAQ